MSDEARNVLPISSPEHTSLEEAKNSVRVNLYVGQQQANGAMEAFEKGDYHAAFEMAANAAGTLGAIASRDSIAPLRDSVGWRPKTLEELMESHEKWMAKTKALLERCQGLIPRKPNNGGAA